jgi:chromosome segregation ATPase
MDAYSKRIVDLEAQLADITQERDKYREDFHKLRVEHVTLETRYDTLECRLRDIERKTRQEGTISGRSSLSLDSGRRQPTGPIRLGLSSTVVKAVDVIEIDSDEEPEVCYSTSGLSIAK